jgi:hypothetical protein
MLEIDSKKVNDVSKSTSVKFLIGLHVSSEIDFCKALKISMLVWKLKLKTGYHKGLWNKPQFSGRCAKPVEIWGPQVSSK